MHVVIPLLVGITIGIGIVVSTHAKETIIWYKNDMPPVYILSGTDQGQGIADRTATFFTKRMPQFNHVFQVATVSRTLKDIKNNDNRCLPALRKTSSREDYLYFSMPVYLIFPNRIIIRKETIPNYIKSGKPVNLNQLIESDNIRIGLTENRNYGGEIEKFIKGKVRDNIFWTTSINNFYQMFKYGRIDAFVSYAFEAMYNLPKGSFLSFPINNTKPLDIAYIVCSKKRVGKFAIDIINSIIVNSGKKPPYRKFYEEYLDENAIHEYHKLSEQIYPDWPLID
ncbi:TIGR02285 family protein [Spartinivicinus ruber]|uniref:TIGR02285 family protein n=1 Tax=Spartinivicinus ruber TaxID=2683272 RepID=UPI0013D1DB48|nr:TIGR02285 family protein [Spartinivicinus ruber]